MYILLLKTVQSISDILGIIYSDTTRRRHSWWDCSLFTKGVLEFVGKILNK